MTAPGGGYAPIHAVNLLVALGPPEAIVPMVQALRLSEPGEVLCDALLFGLVEFGPVVAPVALEALAHARSEDERFLLLSLLARCGARDERISAALNAQLREDPIAGVLNLACYGDESTLASLVRTFEEYQVDESMLDLFAHQTLLELEGAIEELGGSLNPEQRAKVERARHSRQTLSGMVYRMLETLPAPPERQGRRAGPDEPCGCGSGRKSKDCHLGRDPR